MLTSVGYCCRDLVVLGSVPEIYAGPCSVEKCWVVLHVYMLDPTELTSGG